MKLKNFTLTILALLVSTAAIYSQARVQVIHNSADTAAETVDIWLNDGLLLDDFMFRTASPFIDAPAGEAFDIVVQPSNSTDTTNALARFTYILADGETYLLIANGIVSPTGYEPSQPFDIHVYDMGREEANLSGNTDILVHHGSTDAPTIDVVEISVPYNTIVNDISYSEFDGYIEIPTTNLVLNLFEPINGTFATYEAPLSDLGLDNEAITIVASGFLNPENNSNGESFGLWVALADGGELIELPFIPPTPLGWFQLIHNSADAAAAIVDVWIDDALAYDDLPFRFATPQYGMPAGVEFTVSITGPNSPNPENPIWSNTYLLEEDSLYIMVAEGIVSASGYDPFIPFDVAIYDMGRVYSNMPENTDILVHHGSTDAPTVDIYEVGVGAGLIVDDLMYGEYAGYLELETQDYVLEIRDETGMSTVATYEAPLETIGLEGIALTIVASGFLDPTNNSNGPDFGLWVALPSGGPLLPLPLQNTPSTARVQVIHNSADEAAEVVDVWLNDQLLIDDFEFRTASPFIDAPAGVDFDVVIQPSNSTDTTNALARFTYNLMGGSKYVLVANGIVSPTGYDPATPFDIYVYDMGREMASDTMNTDVLVFHGSTDAPVVDVVEVAAGAGTIVDDLDYGMYAGYLELPTADYSLQVRDMTGTTTVAQFGAPLSTLGLDGAALVVVASGFLNPGNNNNGPAFGLYAVLPSGGELVMLPSEPISTARVQVIHNSADAAAETVDVWLNDQLLLDNFMFRTASPFVDAPAGVEFTVSIKDQNSTSPDDPIASFNYTLESNGRYILIANGIVSSTGYEPNQPFDIYVYDMAREFSSSMDNVDVLVFHGSTDAPAVDVVEVAIGAGTIVDDLAYDDFQGYLELPAVDYSLQLRNSAGTDVIIQYSAPFGTLSLGGGAYTVVASGFLNPGNNSNGPAFGLFAILPQGGPFVALPQEPISTARVQVVHNSADAAAETVDIWLNDQLLLDNFMFRTASPFVDAPAGEEFTVAIQDQNSTSPENPIASFNYTLEGGEKYILVANGIVSGSGYDPATPFDIYVFAGAREMATGMGNTDVLVFHGATDAPTVDVVEVEAGAGTIVDDLSYGEYAGYLELPTANYSLDVRDESGSTAVANFAAPLAELGLDGQSVAVFASGFLNPANNSNGEAFGLLAVLPDGTALMLPNTTGVEESVINEASVNIYPSPATDWINIRFQIVKDSKVSIRITDLTGKVVYSSEKGTLGADVYRETIALSNLTQGVYLVNLFAGDSLYSRKIFVR